MSLSSAIKSRRVRGQGMTEYIIIVALIAVAAIGVYSLFGQTVRNQTAGLAQEVAGVDASAEISNASGSSSSASSAANQAKGLATYNGNVGAGGGGGGGGNGP